MYLDRISCVFDRCRGTRLLIPNCGWPAYPICGCTGLALALMLAMTLTRHAGLSYWVMAGVAVAAVATFFGLVMATKVVAGEERIIYYHHEIGVMVVTALLLSAMGKPLLPYLDITILGIGTFLACGRIGCLMVGCCHGRPHRWGIRYSQEHAAAGFPSYLVGVGLFPIQAVESLWVLCVVAVGTVFLWIGKPPGTALAWYVVTYGVGRFFFEFARGDADRPYWHGFSEAQWLSLLLTAAVVWAEFSGVIPFQFWHTLAMSALFVSMISLACIRHFQPASKFQLLHPCHVKQIAGAVELASSFAACNPVPQSSDGAPTFVSIACTSLGVQISANQFDHGADVVYQYTFSFRGEPMSERTARVLARLIWQLSRAACSSEELIKGRGVFHFLMRIPLGMNS
jgi:prolipoprotein diacylglyceryltransferase